VCVDSLTQLQLYLSTDPMNLSFMEQWSMLDSGARGPPPAIGGVWDVITRKITVDPALKGH
jgi:hypothetical protein